MVRTAIITGISGQDGSYLAQLLLGKNYRVIGVRRPNAPTDLWRFSELGISQGVEMLDINLQDKEEIISALQKVKPDEIYNLGDQSSVQASFYSPADAAKYSGFNALLLLETVKETDPSIRFYQASSSEMFGASKISPQNEQTPFQPISPYGASKLTARLGVGNFRNAYGLHASAGIMFNHESPMRGLEFVTRKITYTLTNIACGADTVLSLGNIEAKRDWGYAGDYVEAMWAMLQQDEPDDYVIATGNSYSVKSFTEKAAACLGFEIIWEGDADEIRGFDKLTGRLLVNIDTSLYRPIDPVETVGDFSKALKKLNWEPRVSFEELIGLMVDADLKRVQN
ncbi:MAG: NAD-dependent epimerase/dehydratase family protein [Alphaproteobacteria bacterium]|nr:NAD-dependent epimerase/dehydratase family protein [Alphaproteobacteria bacterium]